MGFQSPLYHMIGTANPENVKEAQENIKSGNWQPITQNYGGQSYTVGYTQNGQIQGQTVIPENLRASQYYDYHKNLQTSIQTATGEYREPTYTEWSSRTPSGQITVSPIRNQSINYVSTPSGVISSSEYMKLQLTTMGISLSSQIESGDYLNTKITNPNLFQRLGNYYSQFKQPSETIYGERTNLPIGERLVLGYSYLSFPQAFSKTSQTTQAFAENYPELNLKPTYTVPTGLQLFRLGSISFAEGQVGGVAFKGTSQLLNIGKTGGTLIGGTMLVGSAPSLISSYKESPLKTIVGVSSGITGFALSPTPKLQPITFQKAAFKEIQFSESNQLNSKGLIELKRSVGLSYKEYNIPFENKGFVKIGTEINGKTPYTVSYKQEGIMLEKGLGGLKESPNGILMNIENLPINLKAVSTRGVIIGKIGEATLTRTDYLGTVTKTFKGSIGKGVGITSISDSGIKSQPFVSNVKGIEIATGSKGSIIYGKSVSMKANEVYIGGSKTLDKIGIAAKDISKIKLNAKGLTLVPSGEKGMTDIFTSRNLNLIKGTTKITPQIPVTSQSTSLKTSFVAPLFNKVQTKSIQFNKVQLRQAQIPKQVQMPKTIQNIKTIQITTPSQIQIPKLTSIQTTPSITTTTQITKQITLPKEVQVPRLITPTINIPTTLSITPTTGIPGFPLPLRLRGFEDSELGKGIIKGRQRKKYTPSFIGIMKGIKGKAPKRLTGLEIRPITKGFNWKNI